MHVHVPRVVRAEGEGASGAVQLAGECQDGVGIAARGADAPARPRHELSPEIAQLVTIPEGSPDVTYIPYARPGSTFAKKHPIRAHERNPNSNPNPNQRFFRYLASFFDSFLTNGVSACTCATVRAARGSQTAKDS